ncbi:MAG: hypothetical protein ACI9NQ_001959 [Paracoccaceae bacterium]|jgi:hypothetical protein
MPRKVEDIVVRLAAEKRVVMIGGLAVIAHGLSRATKDVDVWLDPTPGVEKWLSSIQSLIAPPERIVTLPGWKGLDSTDLLENVENVGMVRVEGLDMPLGLFFRPNGLRVDEFERVWSDATSIEDGTMLPSLLDLLCTKEETNRKRDFTDASFLIGMAREQQGKKLSSAQSTDEAKSLMDAFFDHSVLAQGLENPLPKIREVIWREVENLAIDGDPFAKEMLEERGG